MKRRKLVIGGIVGLFTGLLAGALFVYFSYADYARRSAESLGWSQTTSLQDQAVMTLSLGYGAPAGAAFGLLGGIIGGLVSQKFGGTRSTFLLSVMLGACFGLLGGLCAGFFAFATQ